MAVINIAEAAALSEVELVKGIALSIVTVDAFIAHLPFVTVAGQAITYNRESVAGSAAFIAPGGSSSTTQPQFTRISEPLTRIESLAQIDNFAVIGQSNTNDQLAVTIAAKAKAMARLFQEQVAVGSKSGVTTFNGLRNLLPTGGTVDPTGTTSGGTLTIALMDRMIASVTADDGRVDYITCHVKMINKLKALYRALGGTHTEHVQQVMVPDRYNPDRMRPANFLTYDDVPIYRNDYIGVTETYNAQAGKTRIFCGSFEDAGAPSRVGLFGIMPERLEDMFVVYEPWQDTSSPQWNVRLEMYTGLGLYSDKAMAGIVNIDADA